MPPRRVPGDSSPVVMDGSSPLPQHVRETRLGRRGPSPPVPLVTHPLRHPVVRRCRQGVNEHGCQADGEAAARP